jgi:predicted dehydrogenase
MNSPSKLRFGVLSTAHIATQWVPAVQQAHRLSGAVEVAAVASRSLEVARSFGARFGLAKAYGSYAALLEDPEIDAIYNPLPNHLHAHWSIEAMKRGKHVLCEKPLAMSEAEARTMFDTARSYGVMLLEAYPYWFQPQTRDLLSLIQDGAIGQVRHMQAAFGFPLAEAKLQTDIRMQSEMGGGALYDVGSYCVSLARVVIPRAPVRVSASAQWSGVQPGSGVDMATAATLEYRGGEQVQISCWMNAALNKAATIVGTQGVIETEFLNHSTRRAPSRMRIKRGEGKGSAFEDVRSSCTDIDGNGFAYSVEAFAGVVARQDWAARDIAAQASMDIARTLEAIAQSARSGKAVAL